MKGFYLFVLVITVLILFACSRGGGSNSATDGLASGTGLHSAANGDTAEIQQERSIDDVLTEAESFAVPDSSNVDADVFGILKTELVRQLKERYSDMSRIVANAPAGDAGRVTDLAFSTDTGELSWSYINLGDYDCNGEVGIPDITPIAQNYLAVTNDGIGNDEYETWIDGDKSGEVGISDITPIAQGYLNNVASYQIVTSDTVDGSFNAIGDPIPVSYLTGYPAHINTPLPTGALEYVAVEPLDSVGNAGERSVSVQISSGINPPLITDVNPKGGATGTQVQLSAEVEGTEPFTYAWNFGGGAIPDISHDSSPKEILCEPGPYNASLTVTNSAGSDKYEFALVIETAVPPKITAVTPMNGTAGTDVTFSATVDGTLPMQYEWNFQGIADPAISSKASPTVTLGSGGIYNASLTVSNRGGSDTLNFLLNVAYNNIAPYVFSITPRSGISGSVVQLNADLIGTAPLSYEWNFDGGATPNTSSEASPVVTLGTPDFYGASVTVTNPFGSHTEYFGFNVTDAAIAPYVYTITPLQGAKNTYTQFFAHVDGTPPFAYDWDFGGGAYPDTTTEESPIVLLSGSGNIYSGSVTVSNALGSDTYNFDLSVTSGKPKIYSTDPGWGFEGSEVNYSSYFEAIPPYSFEWDFGGGASPNKSTDESPVVTLGSDGEYNASLTITNPFGSDTYDYLLWVIPGEPNIYDLSPHVGKSGSEVNFSASVDGTLPFIYQWDFGGGAMPNTTIDESPVVTLGSAGSYNASVTVSNGYGSETYDFNLTVFDINWQSETVDSSVGNGYYSSLAIDSEDNMHISYRDGENYLLKYAKWDGSNWNLQELDEGSYTSIALDSNGFPHIGYDSQDGLKYAYWDGAMWNFETSGAYVDSGLSIALDSNDYPHFASIGGSEYALKYLSWDGASWNVEAVETKRRVGEYSSLELDSNDYPHISYVDANSYYFLKYARWDGSSWQIETVDDSYEVGLFSSLELDSNDYAHISYVDYDNDDLKYARWDGSAWQIEVVDSDGYVGSGCSLALDSADAPRIIYMYAEDNFDLLKYAKWNGTSWDIEFVTDTGFVQYPSIALDSNDVPHISYYAGTGEYNTGTLKHAWPK